MDPLRKALKDIAAGYTTATVLARPCYIKHLSYADHIDLDAKREEYFDEAKSNGLPNEQEKLAILVEQKLWSNDKEQELSKAEQYIKDLHEGKRKNQKMPSLVKSYNKQIEQAERDYMVKVAAKRRLLELTCEVYAERCVNDYYVFSNLFSDKELSKPLFSTDEFDWLRDDAVGQIVETYNVAMDGCSSRNIRRIAIQGFFQHQFQLVGDDLMSFFGKPICALTFHQVDLLRSGAHFRNIYQNHDTSHWDKAILDDPDLMTDYARSVEEGKKQLEQQGANDPNAVVLGARAEDARALGIKNQGSSNPAEMKARLLGRK